MTHSSGCECGCRDWNRNWSRKGPYVVASFSNGTHNELLDITAPSKKRWCERWGYDLELRYDLPAVEGRIESWNRFPLALELLEAYEGVLVIGADTIIMDRNDRPFPWAKLKDSGGNHAVVYHQTVHDGWVPNADVMAFTREAIPMIQQIWDWPLDHGGQWARDGWAEQSAYMEVMDYGVNKRSDVPVKLPPSVCLLPLEWNATRHNPEALPTAVIRHATGYGDTFDWKKQLLTEWEAENVA